MKESTISLVMIVKNEERFLKDCLGSVAGVVSEMIIVDTGSTDRTKEIAKKFNAKIYDLVWQDDFAAARNFALEHATGDWILHLDADEELFREDRAQLKALTGNENVFAYMLQINDLAITEIYPGIRLFKNRKGYKYSGKIHENIEDSLSAADKDHFAFSDVRIMHKGYVSDIVRQKEKVSRNLEPLKAIELEDPENIQNNMNLASQYMSLKEFDLAIKYFTKVTLRNESTHPEAFKCLIQCYEAKKQPILAIETADRALQIFPKYIDILFLQGLDLLVLKQYERAIGNFRSCLEADKNIAMPTKIPGSQGILAELFLCLAIYELTKDDRMYQKLDDLMLNLSRDPDALFFLGKHYKIMYGDEYARNEIYKIADKNEPRVKEILKFLFS